MLLALAGFASITAAHADNGGTYPGATLIDHVVVIVQENRSPDNLFHGLPNADIANSGVDSHGNTVPLVQTKLNANFGLSHTHSAFLAMYDGGKMDGADKVSIDCHNNKPGCPTAKSEPQFSYVDPTTVAPYFQLAETYTFGDRMFQSNQGPSFPSHQYLIAGASATLAGSNLSISENAYEVKGSGTLTLYTDCNAAAGTEVQGIDPQGSEKQFLPACSEQPAIMDLLDHAFVSWRYYTPMENALWTAPAAIQHLRFGPDWSNVVIPQTQILTDIGNGQLAGVSWVVPNGQSSDHSLQTDGSGPSWVASIVNAIGNSPFWSSTVIIVVWDDWGGFYDHVPPPVSTGIQDGFRVPLIVVSPYAKPGYVSHVQHDFGSILNFIEETFGLPSLGTADAHADDLADCFNFTQAPLAFTTIGAPLNTNYFKAPSLLKPTPPDDD